MRQRPVAWRGQAVAGAVAVVLFACVAVALKAPTGAEGVGPFVVSLPFLAADSATTSTPSGLIETRNVTSYTDATNPNAPVFFVVGELANGRSNAVERVELTAKFFNAQGQALAVDGDITYADLEVIPAGGDSPFSFAIVSPPAPIASFTITVSGVTDPAILPAVEGITTSVDDTRTEGAFRFVTGIVRNDSSFTWSNVTVLVAYYDAAGRVVRTDLTFPMDEVLAPGEEAEFESFVNAEGTTIATQRIWVRASR
ncbi:MAG: FxLYD domain-containing protein [Dehalococcoidia bacterium]